MRKEAKTCAYLLEPFSLNVRLVCVKVFFALPLANDASVCYGMSRLSFLIMKMYRMLFDAFRYTHHIKVSLELYCYLPNNHC